MHVCRALASSKGKTKGGKDDGSHVPDSGLSKGKKGEKGWLPSTFEKGKGSAVKCFFFNAGLRGGKQCSVGNDCRFLHQRMTDEEYNAPRASSRNNSPSGGDKGAAKGTGRADGKGKGKGKVVKSQSHCFDFAKSG